MKKIVKCLSVLLIIVLLFSCLQEKKGNVKYHCPMHPTVISDKPGDCPICGMKLVPFDEKKEDEKKVEKKKGNVKYHCPMHPTVISDKPGDCPICGMKLVPFDEKKEDEKKVEKKKKIMYKSTMNPQEISESPGKDSMGMEMVPFEVEEGEEGNENNLERSRVSITPEKAKLMNITFGFVGKRKFSKTIRVSATISPDEKRLFKVNTKVDGWVEKLYANTTGQFVKKGEPLLSIYSPDLFSNEQEFLTAFLIARKLSSSPDKSLSENGRNLYESAKKRLLLKDISLKQIEEIEKSGKIEKTLTIYSPISGYVIEKNVIEGQKISQGETLLTVADLSVVWALGDVYEVDIPFIKKGMEVEVFFSYLKKSFKGKVDFIYPFLDPQTRTLKVRIELENKEILLTPEMYSDIYLTYEVGERLVIPDGAILRSGEKSYAFISEDEYSLKPVEVEIGLHNEGYYEVLSGVKEGDKVVTSANFLVDSESSLKYALEVLSRKND